VVEPISLLGNEMGTPFFYQELRAITKKHGVAMIVDETKTGMGSSGKMWAHQHWYLREPADMVTFGGKAGLAGYYAHWDFGTEIK
jgi:4-aminobutyrate aminotransferase/(S)-3-amino-2-methylpropionate transaminase